MEDKLEALIRFLCRRNKRRSGAKGEHLDEEDLAGFLEGKLGDEAKELFKEHLVTCEACLEALALSLDAQAAGQIEVPGDLLREAQKILELQGNAQALEVILKLKENIFEIIKATGDILVGQELVPAPLLRSRQIKDFKNEITVLKGFKNMSLEFKVEKIKGEHFNLLVRCLPKQTSGSFKELRVALIRDNLELESYLSESGSATFENIALGKYLLEVSSAQERLARVSLEIKV